MRCRRYLSKFDSRVLYSVGGLILKDEYENEARQYRSLFLTGLAFIKGKRSLEILISKGEFLRRKYLNDLIRTISTAEIIIFEGPWQYKLLKHLIGGKKIVYDAHNVESQLRKGNIWENYVLELERDLVLNADIIITVAEDDSDIIRERYGVKKEKVVCVPEGFENPLHQWKGFNSNEIVFIGSAYLPNVEAAKFILKMAPNLPQFQFKIIGSVCRAIRRSRLPPNVDLLGELGGKTKDLVMSKSLLAVNPVTEGSGRNLKMNDYISHGIPIVTTEIGARGFNESLKEHMTIVKKENFVNAVLEAASDNKKLFSDSEFFLSYSQNNSYEKTVDLAYETLLSLFKVP